MEGQAVENIDDVFTTGDYVATVGIKDSCFSLVGDYIVGMIYNTVLEKNISQYFERCSCSDAFIKSLIGRIVNITAYIATIAAFTRYRAKNEVEKKLYAESKVTKEVILCSIVYSKQP